MRKIKRLSSIFTVTLASSLLVSPLGYAHAEEKPAVGPTVTPAKPSSTVATTVKSTTERSTTTTERTTTTEKTTTTEEEKVVTRWVDERYKNDRKKDLKPEEKGVRAAEKGKDIEGYEFEETDDTDPKEILHIYKKKEVTYKWVTEKDGKEEILSEKKTIDETTEKDIESKDEDKLNELEFDKKDVSKDKLTVKFIYKKKGEKSSSNDSTKENDKKSEDNKGSESSKSEDTKDGDTPKTTEAPKAESSTKEDTSKNERDSKQIDENSSVSTTEKPAPDNATEAITTGTNSNGEKNPITQPTTNTTTKVDEQITPPKVISVFVNERTGYPIADSREGKSSIAIAGYGFVRTVISDDNRYIHYYKQNNEDVKSTKTTVWKDAYSEEQLLSAKSGEHEAGSIAGYTYVNTYNSGDVIVHNFKKNVKDVPDRYYWSYHVDIDTNELIYYQPYQRWYQWYDVPGYAYVDTDSWTDSNGITYYTHYYKKIATTKFQIDPAKVFTVWVDEYYNQIVPSRMGSHEAGELEGYEFDRTVSINSGYGIAHVYKKKDGDRLAGKDKDKSLGYRVRSMLPRTSAKDGNNILPIGIIGAAGVAVAGGVYYVLRRKENNDQNNNNFPPYSGQ